MKVAEIMETDVETVTLDTPVSEALVTLADARVSGLPVVDNRKRVIGVVSSTDLIGAQTETLREAARHMLYADVHRLFVEENGVLVGVISQTDVVRAVATGKIA